MRCGEGFGLRSLSLSHSFSLPRVMCGILAVGVSVTCISVASWRSSVSVQAAPIWLRRP